ncbi:MAG: beta-N-acetylhexosaminidase [Enterococcus sp.]|jgi:hexosaminidase|nr:beta-N-acetylhexosaminidase [Enterococcus sp.]
MKALHFTGDLTLIEKGVKLLSNKLNFTWASDGTIIQVRQQGTDLIVSKSEDEIKIVFDKPAHFFRGLTLLLKHWDDPSYELHETPHFDLIGPMVDTSRNAVPTIEKIKALLETCSTMGLNQFMLYMEDTYEIPEYPYFGYMRGRYTYEQLKELDDYGFALGIEVIPSIQVLGHLKNPLKWNFAREMKDTEDILLVDEPKTYAFLEKAIQAASKPFRTKKIHIGMDEAHTLGLGRYLQKNGFTNRFDIMNRHLAKVLEITNQLDLEVEMWSDMYFRLGSKTGDYYDPEFDIPKEVVANIPDVKMVYWDYYHHNEAEYHHLLESHKLLEKPIVFAGGIWTWNGIAPNYGKSIASTQAALNACKKQGIQSIYATLWGDDGAETPLDSALLGLQLFAEHQFNEEVSDELLAQRFNEIQNEEMAAFLLLDLFDQTPGVAPNNPDASAVSKIILYQDLLLGLYDETISHFDLTTHYTELAKQLKQAHSSEKISPMFHHYTLLADLLAIKADLGNQLQKAYLAQDKEEMTRQLKTIARVKELVEELRLSHRQLWFEANKPFGWEILDIRYGGILSRIDTTVWRITEWLTDNDPIEELAEMKRPFDGPYLMPEGMIGRNLYHGIISPSKLSDV